ncbi:MAG: type II toxin-antitoxin system HicA family toxin [Euryarchaeota archaeon]|nr:type II toxin-antitoxin system HicA family toxin [Euryarchaeota archaeon]
MAQLPGTLDGRRFLRALARFGWSVESQCGSHRKLAHPARSDKHVVAFHNVITRNSVRQVLRHIGLDEEDFLREY